MIFNSLAKQDRRLHSLQRLLLGAGVFTVTILVAACQISDNPRQGGFLNAVTGIFGGVYEGRINERTEVLAGERETQKALKGQETALNLEHQRLQQELQRMEHDLAYLDEDINNYRRRLQNEKEHQAAKLQELRQAQAEIEKLRNTVEQAKQRVLAGEDQRQQIDALKERISKWQNVINTMTGKGIIQG